MRRRGTLLFPRADGEMRTEADKARQAHPDRAQPRWDRRELPAHLPALQSARALRTRRSTLTASAVTARAAGCSYGPRRCLVVSACMTRGTNERDVGSSRPRRSLRSRADPPPQRPEDHVRDVRPPRARLPARRRSIACEAREICCIRGNQALLESCPRGAFSGFGASCSTKDHVGSDSSQSQVFAPFTEDFADRLRTLLSVMEVAERLAVSTKTVYALCASGTLRHFRVLNAIRVAPADLEAYLLAART